MNENQKNRILGVFILITLAVIITPIFFNGSGKSELKYTNIETKNDIKFKYTDKIKNIEEENLLAKKNSKIIISKKQVKNLKELNKNDKKTSWVIRAGSFVEKQNALKLIKKLEYIKEKSFLLKINKKNKFFYTVNIGPFFSASETKKIFLDIINKEEFKNSFIIESNY
jgi:cell division septation protein DedD